MKQPERFSTTVQAWTRASGDTRGGSVLEYVMILGIVALTLISGFKYARMRENRTIAQQAAMIRTLDNTAAPDIVDFTDPLFGSDFSAPVCTRDGVCSRPGQCFAAGTLVATEEGLRPIEDVREGDLVLSRDEVSGAIALRPVLKRYVTPAQAVMELSIATNEGGEAIRATTGHPFWVNGRGWVPAAQLSASDALWSSSGETVHLALSPTKAPTYETVYNFEVGEYHTYFVGHRGVWVHNGGPSPQGPPNGGGSFPCQNPGGTTPDPPDSWSKWKWDNLASGPTWGHTFTEHGAPLGNKRTPTVMTDRARGLGQQNGQWMDNAAAAKFISEVAKLGPGVHDVPVPPGLGRTFLPDGTERPTDMARVIVNANGSVKTAFPYDSSNPN